MSLKLKGIGRSAGGGFPPLTPGTIALGTIGAVDIPVTSPENAAGGPSGGTIEYRWLVDDVEYSAWGVDNEGNTITGRTPGTAYSIVRQARNSLDPGTVVESNTLTPTTWQPSDEASLEMLLREQSPYCFTDDPPVTVCVATDLIQVVSAQQGTSPYGVQATSGTRPTFQTDGAQFDTTDDIMSLSSAVALGTGDFTAYCTFIRASAGVQIIPIGTGNGWGFIRIANTDQVQMNTNTPGNFAQGACAVSGSVTLRIRRVSGVVYAAWTGQSEFALTSFGDSGLATTFDCIGALPGLAQYNGSLDNRLILQSVFSSNLSSTNRTRMEQYIEWATGVAL